MKKKLVELNTKLNALVIFREILSSPVIMAFQGMIHSLEKEERDKQVNAYGIFVSALFAETSNFSVFINTFLLNNENVYIKKKAKQELIPSVMKTALKEELQILEELSNVSSAEVRATIGYGGYLADWENTVFDFTYEYQEKLHALWSTGYGIFAKHSMFRLADGEIIPVKFPDNQRIDQLFGYQREQDLVIKNTKALISGNGASNMLLYGDAGTGKSSTIKAVANSYSNEGLRLVEVRKQDLFQLPSLIETLSSNPLKFILFIDDLSFTSNDDNFSALKAILEGSATMGGKNIAIYATSNRRHLVKETVSQRAGDELHLNDTLQETMSLAARFGLTITYQRPDKEEYLEIVEELALAYSVEMDKDELFRKAEIHALRANGRTPRGAKQFIELLKMGME